ncbi:MAG: hypothetical protein K8R85_12190 [Bacteroidetes bacterium]|nr:hypothetical protein [Bacteroidota bacterium]
MYRFLIKVLFILVCLLISETGNGEALTISPFRGVGGGFSSPPIWGAEERPPIATSPLERGLRGEAISDTIIQPVQENSFLKEKITYSATDSLVLDMANQKAYLYNNAIVIYEDMRLEAGYIELDFGKNVLFSRGVKDSLGNIVQKPVSNQNGEKFNAGEITYNFKTKKGKIRDVITKQGDGYIHGRDIKKDSNNMYYVAHGKYTTCDLDHPHYYIGASKIKVIPNEKIITGPAELFIADIPTPLILPFGYFPNKKGRASGILLPTYGESNQWGFFLKDGGFYFGMSEYVDLALRGDVYANGSFGGSATSNYNNRYHYNGDVALRYSEIIDGDRELPNSTKSNVFFVNWRHVQDPKSNPNSRFSANVNAGSSSYNKFKGNVTGNYLSNTFQSNVAYTKILTGTPFNFSANARHSQNTITKKVDVTLPELALSMNRIYPFKNKSRVGNKWYDKIGLSATANARNEINTYDSLFFTNNTVNQMRNGARFTVPIGTSLNVMKYFTFTPTISTGSSIYRQSVIKRYDLDSNKVFTDTIDGFNMANDFSLSAGLNTRVYGNYFFRTKRLKQIRHVASPTISASYRPDFSESQFGYYQNVQIDTTGVTQQYSRFQNGIYGSPASGRSGIVSFGLNNTLEAKIKQFNDSGSVDKKVSLIDNFSASVSYNVAAKNYQWSNINLNGRTKLFKVLDVNANALIDPYQIDTAGARVEKFEWERDPSKTSFLSGRHIGRLTSAALSLSTSLRSKEKTAKPKTSDEGIQDELDYYNKNPQAYIDFNVPWNINIYYNLNYSKTGWIGTKILTQTATFNGDLSLTKNWKISLASGYDFTNKKVTVTSINIYRDLHCWEMRFNWVPFGFRQSFSLDLNVKSAMLKDLKLTRKKDWYDYQ